jgi:hypothetical protein
MSVLREWRLRVVILTDGKDPPAKPLRVSRSPR